MTAVSARTRGIPAFLLLTFAIAWISEFGLWSLGFSLANPLAQIPAVFAPAMSAFVVRRWVTREGFADAGLRLRLRQAWPQYLAAWLGPLVFTGTTLAIAAVLGLWQPVAPTAAQWGLITLLMLVQPLMAPATWGEEFGWTSYLRLRLFPGRPVAATLGTGIVLSVWHYPLAFVGYAEFSEIVLGLASWTAYMMSWEIVLSWLRLRSGTIWTSSLAHIGGNMVLALLTGQALDVDPGTQNALMTIPVASVAVWIILTGRIDGRTTRSEPPVIKTGR
ncbi:type II CAAX prenyl endopeptidase Rce1 family protein [Actinophytocola sp.]|uniref:CPBP family glutamic-type intramembrane protease n=1 Tax=Actinophytocola sp. TaxID=1872138 RepID=UPI00389ADB1A